MDLEQYATLTAVVFAVSMAISLGEMFWLTVISKKEKFVHALGTGHPATAARCRATGLWHSREVNSRSWWDVQLSEARVLIEDVRHAPTLKSKVLYLFMPPGWSHTGEHKMIHTLRAQAALSIGS